MMRDDVFSEMRNQLTAELDKARKQVGEILEKFFNGSDFDITLIYDTADIIYTKVIRKIVRDVDLLYPFVLENWLSLARDQWEIYWLVEGWIESAEAVDCIRNEKFAEWVEERWYETNMNKHASRDIVEKVFIKLVNEGPDLRAMLESVLSSK